MELMTSPVYCTEIVIAKGMEPQHGTDAWIEYFFNTEINAKPAYNEDGTVDFHQLSNIISHIEKGDLLARLHPEDRGKSGKDVTGKETLPRTVKGKRLQVGKNIRLSEDGMEAFSEVTGHARVYNEQIFVSDVYEVPADVDNSTGNIDYKGNVYIKGSVREGFTVFAEGDVVVDGKEYARLVRFENDFFAMQQRIFYGEQPHFVTYYDCNGKHFVSMVQRGFITDIKRFTSDDEEYNRVCAEELVELLNQKQ